MRLTTSPYNWTSKGPQTVKPVMVLNPVDTSFLDSFHGFHRGSSSRPRTMKVHGLTVGPCRLWLASMSPMMVHEVVPPMKGSMVHLYCKVSMSMGRSMDRGPHHGPWTLSWFTGLIDFCYTFLRLVFEWLHSTLESLTQTKW